MCVLNDNFPTDDDLAAIAWCKFVDGVNVFPKLPVHIRTHREAFERNQRVMDSIKRAESGQYHLEKLNRVIKPSPSQNIDMVSTPAPLPDIQPAAMHNSQNIVTANMCVGPIPECEPIRKKRGRSSDRKPRAPRSCRRCQMWYPDWKHCCTGRVGTKGADGCDYFDGEGKRRCGRCHRNGSIALFAYLCDGIYLCSRSA
mmetsp:Transcript_44085/g.92721  ORF Transcript_44085/g.92721 Transcript_44085/m.92721 type:complete len:199 (-) Transcript_44085:260-856(-)